MKCAHGLEEMGHYGVYLVIGAGGVVSELEHAHVGGLDVEGDGADVVVYVKDYVAGFGLGMGDVIADEAGEVAVDYLHEVAALKVNVVKGIIGESVLIGSGKVLQALHLAVGDGGVAGFAASVYEEGETVVTCAEGLYIGEDTADKDIMEDEVGGTGMHFAVALFAHDVGGGEKLDVLLLEGVEEIYGFARHLLKGGAYMVEHIPGGRVFLL